METMSSISGTLTLLFGGIEMMYYLAQRAPKLSLFEALK